MAKLLRFNEIFKVVKLMRNFPKLHEEALVTACQVAVDHNNQGFFNNALSKLKPDLQQYTRSWAMTGYAGTHFGQYQQVIQWISDWRNRKELEPWMLTNLTVAYTALKRYKEAEEVSRAAVGLRDQPIDQATHSNWLAYLAVREHRYAEAEKLLHAAESSKNKDFYGLLYMCSNNICQIAQSHMSNTAEADRRLVEMRHYIHKHSLHSKLSAEIYDYARTEICRITGLPKGRHKLETPSQQSNNKTILWTVVIIIFVIIQMLNALSRAHR